ncbi:MAG TPA: sodium:solute symporter family protein [Anaeromyxobacteraceae bacterium]|nr:sodium:solute symporter family protein [Anaeromyxobacteraceae bacterium]
MGASAWTWVVVAATFALYAAVAVWAQARFTREYYVADRSTPPVLSGMATAADWISAASFLSMAGLIAFSGRDGSAYLMGWTGGYVLLAVLLAPYLRKYGKFTVPQFVGERYYSRGARVLALLCAVLISFTYVAGQVRGVGVVLSGFLGTSVEKGILVGMAAVFLYAVLGGMRGATHTQVAQYVVFAVAYLTPAVLISLSLTGQPVPALGLGAPVSAEGAAALGVPAGQRLLEVIDRLNVDLGFRPFTAGWRPRLDVLMTALALMAGTAGLPHIIVRFFTVPKIRDARASAGWALLFVAVLYTAVPAMAAFARATFVAAVHDQPRASAPEWFARWEATGLLSWDDRNGDGRMQLSARDAENEVRVDYDIMVLATPEMARLPAWVVGLVAAGALAAALSTAAGLLLVIGSAVAHDLGKSTFTPNLSERNELRLARFAVGVAVLLAGAFAMHPPGSVAQVVALAFGLAASSFFPALVTGIFWRRATREGAMAGMASGILFTSGYIAWFRFVRPDLDGPAHWWLGISPEGIGAVGMVLAFAVIVAVSLRTPAPRPEVQEMVASLRYPRAATGPRRERR